MVVLDSVGIFCQVFLLQIPWENCDGEGMNPKNVAGLVQIDVSGSFSRGYNPLMATTRIDGYNTPFFEIGSKKISAMVIFKPIIGSYC